MNTTTAVIGLGVVGVGGYFLYRHLKAPTSSGAGKSPSGNGPASGGSIWDQLNAAFGGSKGGSPTDAQQAAGVFVGLGALANGIGSLAKGLGWGSGSTPSNSDTASSGVGGAESSWQTNYNNAADSGAGSYGMDPSTEVATQGEVGSDDPFGPGF